MLFSNEGCCIYTWRLPQQADVFDGPSVYGTFLVGLSALWGQGSAQPFPESISTIHATLGFQAREGFWLLLFQVVGKVRTRTAWSLQVPKEECFGARRRCLPENPLRLSVGCLLEGPVSQDS